MPKTPGKIHMYDMVKIDKIGLLLPFIYIHTCAMFNKCIQTLRTNSIWIRIIRTCCSNSIFERSFMYAAPILWDRLSQDIRMLDFVRFKSSMKTELYLKYFEA